MTGRIRAGTLAVLLAAMAGGAWAQVGIFTCTDAKGRRLTSDRWIPECSDREQRVLGPTGTVRQIVPPQLTAVEQAAKVERDKKAAEDKLREADERRAARAMLNRYPTQAVHDAERRKALKTADDAITVAQRNIEELARQKRKLDEEAEFYKPPAPMAPKLKRQFDDNANQVGSQRRFIENQTEEKQRVNARFDLELVKLRGLWAAAGPTVAASATPAASAR
jgi:hypothetical protein